MCLALPALVVALLDGGQAQIDLGGVKKRVSIELVPEARVGDYVIVHVGHAIGLIDAEEAAHTLALFAEMNQLTGGSALPGGDATGLATPDGQHQPDAAERASIEP